jgi:enoyl-CoA hydratase/carnithine racemase
MAFQDIILRKEDHIATIVFNRPEKLNALTRRMMDEVETAISDVANDNNVRVLVLTGAGRAFCSGGDFNFSDVREGKVKPRLAEELGRHSEADWKQGRLLSILNRATSALQHLDKPTIAMIRGDVVGGGFGLALACDMRVGADNARFMMGYPKVGSVPGMGEMWLLPHIVGLGKALELIMTSEFCSAEEAYRIGLLNRLVAPDLLEQETVKLANGLMKIPPITQRFLKMHIYGALGSSLETSMAFSSACNFILKRSEDGDEAIRALAEKRAPVFKNG